MNILDFFRKFILSRKSLKYKLLVAFSLMSIIPLLVLAYLISYSMFPQTSLEVFQLSAILIFTFWIVLSGYILAKAIIVPVIDLAIETKIIANGNYDSKLTIKRDDEIGEIVTAVNTMTDKMRGYLRDLEEYSKETANLNVRIHRKVLTLTNLMRLGDLISSGAPFDEVSNFAAERMAGELYGGFCAILLKQKNGEYLLKSFADKSGKDMNGDDIRLKISQVEKLFSKYEYLSIDEKPLVEMWQKELRAKLPQINIIVFPMKIKSNILGAIAFGGFGEGMEFNNEDIEVLRAFEKELVLGYQSSQVLERVKSLEVVDALTGLYTFHYLEDRLEDEINRAVYYQRPCSFVILNVDEFSSYSNRYGAQKAKDMLKQIARILNEAVPPVSKVARSDRDEFGIILPEKNKREGLNIAEDIRKRIELLKISTEEGDKVTVSIGVGENPIDGANAKEIISRARNYVEKARAQGRNKVVGE